MAQDTKTHILDTAECLTALRGFDAFSYRDIAEKVDIKTSSIHYYFPAKSDLAAALVDRYMAKLGVILQEVSDSGKNGIDQIKAVLKTINDMSGIDKNMCVCARLSADVHVLNKKTKGNLDQFFTLLENWLESALKTGVQDGSIHAALRAKSTAIEIAATIEGAMLLARVRNDPEYLQNVFDIIIARLRG